MFRSIVLGLATVVVSASAAFAQAAPAAPAQAAAAPNPFVFPGDAGVILNFVKADKTADFEMVLGKAKEAQASRSGARVELSLTHGREIAMAEALLVDA